MSYAAAQDVTDRLGRDVSGNTALITLITTRLSDVERLIKRRIPDLDAQLAADPPTIDVEDVKQVEAEAVLRLARNPEGYISETDGTYTYQLAQDMSAGSLEILPDEWEILGVSSSAMVIIAPKAVVHGCFPPHWWRWQQ
jgi:hypothetical protein